MVERPEGLVSEARSMTLDEETLAQHAMKVIRAPYIDKSQSSTDCLSIAPARSRPTLRMSM